MSGSTQYLRYISLIVAGGDNKGIDLSNMRIKFSVKDPLNMTPMSLYARVYNLSDQTINNIISIGQNNPATGASGALYLHGGQGAIRVILQAGYQSNYGILFDGTVYQYRVGHETNVDSYLDLFAAEEQLGHNWAVMNRALAAGWKQSDVWEAAGQTLTDWGLKSVDKSPDNSTTSGPRAKVLFGPTREKLRQFGTTNAVSWNMRNGTLKGAALKQTIDSNAIVLSPSTGLIGYPEQTQEGIRATCLLNPQIGWGTTIKIEGSINQVGYYQQGQGINDTAQFAALNPQGLYKVLLANHYGDTRENSWYTDVTCISIDPTANTAIKAQLTGFSRGDPLE